MSESSIICFGSSAYAPFVLAIEDNSAGMSIQRLFVRCTECNLWMESGGRFGVGKVPNHFKVPNHLYDLRVGSHPFSERPKYKLAIEILRHKESRRLLDEFSQRAAKGDSDE